MIVWMTKSSYSYDKKHVKLLNDANFFSKKYHENFFWNTIKHYEM